MTEENKKHFIHGESYVDGVMYNDSKLLSVSIRTHDGEIKSFVQNRESILNKNKKLDHIIIRGLIDFYEGSINQSMAEQHIRKMKNKKNTKQTRLNHAISVLSIMLFGMILYFIIPTVITFFLQNQIQNIYFLNILEIILRLGIFVLTFILICSSKSVKKSSCYHGAEHKVLNCCLKGKQLSMDNIKKQSIYNSGCGTSLLLMLILVSIPFMIFLPYNSILIRIIIILALSPIWLGLSMDITLWLAKSESKIAKIFGKPGMILQRLNTKLPSDEHIEVALRSIKNILAFEKQDDKIS